MAEHTSSTIVRSGSSPFERHPDRERHPHFPIFDITAAESPFPQQPLNQTLLEGTIPAPNRPNTFVYQQHEKTQNSLN